MRITVFTGSIFTLGWATVQMVIIGWGQNLQTAATHWRMIGPPLVMITNDIIAATAGEENSEVFHNSDIDKRYCTIIWLYVLVFAS